MEDAASAGAPREDASHGSGHGLAHAWREAVTISLYLCIVLAAQIVVIEHQVERTLTALGVIWGSMVGLTLAHIFAFDLSARLFKSGAIDGDTRLAMGLQVAAAVVVASVLSIPFFFVATSTAVDIDVFLIVAFIGITAYGVARVASRSAIRAVIYAAIVLAAAAVVVSVKVSFSGH